jgi:CDP-glucose 4,6-dehydratase
VVVVTSDKCYANEEWAWGYRESDRLGGRDPYSSSKACAELVTDAYRSSFFAPTRQGEHGVAVASARAGNVIGGGDWAADRIVPDAMRAFIGGLPLLVRNPGSVRPWQHVLEPLAGYLQLAERLVVEGVRFGQAWNFGPTDELVQPVRVLAERLAARWGAGAGVVMAPEATGAPHEAGLLRLDASKARSVLGWQPVLGLEDALDWIVEWHQAVEQGAAAREVCERQIGRYTERWERRRSFDP